MALYAIDDLDDALSVTRGFLTPIDGRRWAKLALVVLFVGGAGGGAPVSAGGDGGQVPAVEFGPRVWLLVAAVAVVAVVLALAFVLVGSIMEFVFVESLRTGEVTLRRYWRRRWRQGLRLFAFRLVLGLLLLGGALLVAATVVLPLIGFGTAGGLWIVAGILLVPLFVVLAVVGGLVWGFTTVFVVPIMVLEDCGVLAGWRRLWPTVVRDWKQYLAYALVNLLLSVAAGLVVGLATALLALVLLVPFGIAFALGAGLFAFVSEPAGLLVLVLVGIAFALAVIAAAALVQVPVQSYLRYYALLVLGDVEPAFDLIPDRRAAVREEDSSSN